MHTLSVHRPSMLSYPSMHDVYFEGDTDIQNQNISESDFLQFTAGLCVVNFYNLLYIVYFKMGFDILLNSTNTRMVYTIIMNRYIISNIMY